MPKQIGIFKIAGSLDGMTFYKSGDGHLVRKSGGVSKKRIQKDPAFARTRENNNEFGKNAQAAKMLRDAVGNMVNRAKDPKTSNRLMQIFNQIKNYDEASVRGDRKISTGLQNEAGRNLLAKFDFNERAQMRNVLRGSYDYDAEAGTIALPDFDPKMQLAFPDGTSHASISFANLGIDFDTGANLLVMSEIVNFSIRGEAKSLNLSAPPPGNYPIQIGLLLAEFFQEVNGVQYPLNNGAYNAMMILDVRKS